MKLFWSQKLLCFYNTPEKKIYICFLLLKTKYSVPPIHLIIFCWFEVLCFLISGKQQHCSLIVKSLPELNSSTFVAIPLLHSRIPELPTYHLEAKLSVFSPSLPHPISVVHLDLSSLSQSSPRGLSLTGCG